MQPNLDTKLFNEIIDLINQSRRHSFHSVNNAMSQLYFKVGQLLDEAYHLSGQDENSESKLILLATELSHQFGNSWNERLLRQCLQFYQNFKDYEHLEKLTSVLSWPVIKELMYIEDPVKREFLINMAIMNQWSFKDLCRELSGMFYERVVTASKPEELIKTELEEIENNKVQNTERIFEDSSILNFLQLESDYVINDFRSALMMDTEKTLGAISGFMCQVCRNYTIEIEEFQDKIDLVFYHRILNSLVAVNFYIGEFKPVYKSDMDFHIMWLDQQERLPYENEPIGMIICIDIDAEEVDIVGVGSEKSNATQLLLDSPSILFLKQALTERVQSLKDLKLAELANRKHPL